MEGMGGEDQVERRRRGGQTFKPLRSTGSIASLLFILDFLFLFDCGLFYLLLTLTLTLLSSLDLSLSLSLSLSFSLSRPLFLPLSPSLSLSLDLSFRGWVLYSDPTSGHPYYYNAVTDESVWQSEWPASAPLPSPDDPDRTLDLKFNNMLNTAEGRMALDAEVARLEAEEAAGIREVKVKETLWEDVRSVVSKGVALIPPAVRNKAGIELPYVAGEDDDESSSSGGSGSDDDDDEGADIEGGGGSDSGSSSGGSSSGSSSSSSSDSEDSESEDEPEGNAVTRAVLATVDAIQPIYDGSVNRLIRTMNASAPMALFYAASEIAHGALVEGRGLETDEEAAAFAQLTKPKSPRKESSVEYGGERNAEEEEEEEEKEVVQMLPPPPFYAVGGGGGGGRGGGEDKPPMPPPGN